MANDNKLVNLADLKEAFDTLKVDASQSASGLMSATDKTKLDGIAAGAQVNSITGVKGNAESSYRTGNVNLTPANIGAIATSAKGAASGVAELDSNGKVPSSQLPSYVDDVLEYAKSSSFPTTGEAGKIYIAQDTNTTYRWSGTAYVEISASLALGTTSSTAYRGDYGNAAYTHAVTNKGSAFSSGLYKITTNSEGHVTGATAVAKSDITGLGIPGSDTTYTFDGTYNSSTNKAATVSTVTNAIAALDGNLNDTTPGAGKTLTAFSETDGKVNATFGNISITKSQVSDLGTIGAAAAKGVDTSIAASSTSTNLPTSQAVAAFVEGKGYKTTDNNTTYSLTQDSSDGHKITLTPSSGTAQTITIPDNNTDTKVTSAANHYTPSRDTSADKSASASGATAAWSIDVVKGVTVQTDGKGHVTGVAVTSGKIPGNPNTDTHRPIQVNGTQVLGNDTTALNLKAGSNVSITNSSGTVTIAATDTTYSSKAAASGGTDVSLVTTGEKATWNAKTSNVGTITGITMNGASKGTSGVVDLGTVITSHQDISGKAPLASPALTGTPTAPTAATTTENTQIATTAYVKNKIDSVLAANDAMIFKGTIGSSGATVTALPNTHNAGWTYKVITAATYAGKVCEAGDLIICITDGTTANNDHWTVVQTNVDGAVTGPTSSTGDHIATFNGTSGKVIKDSGYTIAKSVPSNAVFTDTDTKVTAVGNHYTPAEDTSAKLSADASSSTAATWNSTSLVTGVDIKRDAKGHVVGVAVDSIKMPANPNSDTHRAIQVNGTQALGNNTTALNLKAGSNVTITDGGSGAITIAATDTNTWRGIQDNLTSSSNTTESLSAKQGYLLANGSARDSTKVSKSGDTMTGDLIIGETSSDGTVISSGSFKIGAKNDNYGVMPFANNWNSLGASNLQWYRSYVVNYYGTTSHIANWDSNNNIGTAASSSAASVKGLVNFYNECAAGGTQTKTALQASANSNITLTLPNATGTLALSGHTHATSIATSTGTNQITLAANTKYAITAGGTSYVFTTPSDTNTWRPVSDSVSSTSSSDAASSKAVKTAYDLAASKTANTGTVTSVATGVGLTGGTITGSGTLKAKLRSETALTIDSAAATTTSGRVYPVAVDKTGYLAVNVPWTDSKPVTSVAGKTGAVTLTNSDVGLGNVENKSSATIRGELTKANVTTALGYTPPTTDTNTWRPIGKTSSDAAAGNTVIADSTARTISAGTSSAYSITNLTANHVVAAWRFSGGYTDNNPPADITVTTANGSYTIQASNLLATGITMQPVFIKT